MTYTPSCWCLLHTISPSSLCVLLMLFISVSLYLQDQSDKSKSDDDWGREDVVDRTYKQKDFYYCCSGSYSVFDFFVRLVCILSPPAPPAWKCLIIDKLQKYQYHICLYFCFKDNNVVYFLTLCFEDFNSELKMTKKNLVMLHSQLLICTSLLALLENEILISKRLKLVFIVSPVQCQMLEHKLVRQSSSHSLATITWHVSFCQALDAFTWCSHVCRTVVREIHPSVKD